MAFFGKDQPPVRTPGAAPAPPSQPSTAGRQPTVIATGSSLSGKMSGATDVQIEGEFEGQLDLDGAVTVGSGGRVRGEIHARTARIAGNVVGNVHGQERVEVLASGSVEGDVSAPRVVISEGAFLRGKVEMTGNQKPAKPGEKPAPKPPDTKPANGGDKGPEVKP